MPQLFEAVFAPSMDRVTITLDSGVVSQFKETNCCPECELYKRLAQELCDWTRWFCRTFSRGFERIQVHVEGAWEAWCSENGQEWVKAVFAWLRTSFREVGITPKFVPA